MKRLIQFIKPKRSGSVARERLNRLLMSDRLLCSPVLIEHIKEDLCRILNKYNEIDTSRIEVEIICKNEESPLNPSIFIHVPFNQNTQE